MDETTKEMIIQLGPELAKLGLRMLNTKILRPKKVTPERQCWMGDIAIVLSLTRPIKSTVEDFLYKERIIADIVEIERKKRLSSNGKEWMKIVSEFYKIFLKIQNTLGAPTYHLFLSAPPALTFALGSVLGLNYDVRIYHWFEEINRNKCVLTTSRKLFEC